MGVIRDGPEGGRCWIAGSGVRSFVVTERTFQMHIKQVASLQCWAAE